MKKWKTKEKNNEIFYFIFAAFRFESSSNRVVKRHTSKTGIYIQRIFRLYKKFHPLVKTANLEINKAQASLMAERRSIQN
jgi:hypothetical protein